LHRAFSVFIFNNKGETLLQQRATTKYHSPLLWTNACCSHPREGETYEEAALRRMPEEIGLTTEIEEAFWFIYRADVGQGLTEHELDHVFIGYSNDEPELNPEEACNYKWMKAEDVKNDIASNPDLYTEWFKIIFNKYYEHIELK
ncbi:MAG: isopentenyl-diphosphate Delta-isomerase, partial [Bacteroidetes bacterium]|nr:isopentenyl-diphosphate Delta-isomerase [Bacteroidota bacterium]